MLGHFLDTFDISNGSFLLTRWPTFHRAIQRLAARFEPCIAHQANEAERADLDALLAREPGLRADFTRLEADARLAKDVLPLVAACNSSTGQFPAYARERLQTTVRQTFGRPQSAPKEPDRSPAWGWRWVLGLAGAAAVVVIVALFNFSAPNAPVIGVAILDTVGGTRVRTWMKRRLFKERGRKVQSNAFPAQANWKRGRKIGPMAIDGLRLKSFTIPRREMSEYPGVPEGSLSKKLLFWRRIWPTTLQQGVEVFVRGGQTKR